MPCRLLLRCCRRSCFGCSRRCELGVEKGIRAAATERRDMIDFGEVEQSFPDSGCDGDRRWRRKRASRSGARVVVEAVERPDAVALQLAELPGSDVANTRKSERAAVDVEEEIRQLGVGVVVEVISPIRGLVLDEAVVDPIGDRVFLAGLGELPQNDRLLGPGRVAVMPVDGEFLGDDRVAL